VIALDVMVRTGPLESRYLTDGGQECEAVPRGAARGAQQSLFSDASWHRYCTVRTQVVPKFFAQIRCGFNKNLPSTHLSTTA